MARELQFFERVKTRLRSSRDAYNDLIKVIHLYNQELVGRSELMALATDVLGKHPDLMVSGWSAVCVGGGGGRGSRQYLDLDPDPSHFDLGLIAYDLVAVLLLTLSHCSLLTVRVQ